MGILLSTLDRELGHVDVGNLLLRHLFQYQFNRFLYLPRAPETSLHILPPEFPHVLERQFPLSISLVHHERADGSVNV